MSIRRAAWRCQQVHSATEKQGEPNRLIFPKLGNTPGLGVRGVFGDELLGSGNGLLLGIELAEREDFWRAVTLHNRKEERWVTASVFDNLREQLTRLQSRAWNGGGFNPLTSFFSELK
jgi:hypothetical protein